MTGHEAAKAERGPRDECASSHDGHPCGACDGPGDGTEKGPEPLTLAERESLARLMGGHIVPLNGHPCITCAVQAEVERIVADRLAPVEALAADLAAWDLGDMAVPESVDVPDDYELAMNDAGALLHVALRPTPPVGGRGGDTQ